VSTRTLFATCSWLGLVATAACGGVVSGNDGAGGTGIVSASGGADARGMGGSATAITGGRPASGGSTAAAGSGAVGASTSTGGVLVRPSPLCGNGIVEAGEDCDGRDLQRVTCAEATMSPGAVGTLTCNADCTFNVSGCALGAPPPSPYTCLDGRLPPPPMVDWTIGASCGSWDGGPEMGYCIARDAVLMSGGLIDIPQDVCGDAELCVPQSKALDPSSCFTPCQSPLGGDGACAPTYVVEGSAAGMGISSALGQVTCLDGETCVPCVSPLDGSRTGACDF
jgi:hypothetical protein